MLEIDKQPNAPAEQVHPTTRLGGRWAIILLAIVFGAISVMSFVGFLFNLTINYPETDRAVIAVDPLWMLGHLIRGSCLGFLAYKLLRYQATLKRWHLATAPEMGKFARAHSTLWGTGAIVLGILLINSIVYVAFGGPKL